MEQFVKVRDRHDAYRVWDKRSVVIRVHEDGRTTVYPSLPRGVRYFGFSLRDEYVIARLATLQDAIRYCNHCYYVWSVIGKRRHAPGKDV